MKYGILFFLAFVALHLTANCKDNCTVIAVIPNFDSVFHFGKHTIAVNYFSYVDSNGELINGEVDAVIEVEYDGKQIFRMEDPILELEAPVLGEMGGSNFLYFFPGYVLGPYPQNFNSGILILFKNKNYKIFYNVKYYNGHEICGISFLKKYHSWFMKNR